MIYLIVAAEVRVILLQGIIPVRTCADYFLDAIAIHDLNISLHQSLREIFIPPSHG